MSVARPPERWDSFAFDLGLRDKLEGLYAELQSLGKSESDVRLRNRKKLERHVLRYGLQGPALQLHQVPSHEIARRLTILAELAVAKVCMHPKALADPRVMRANLKAARDCVGEAILFETELRDYLRAKNKTIGWLLVGLDAYLGPDVGPSATWGRSSEPPQGAAYDAALNERYGLVRRVWPGPPPPDPSLEPNAGRVALERVLVRKPKLWLLPALLQLPVVGKRSGLSEFDYTELVLSLRIRCVASMRSSARFSSTLEHLIEIAQYLRDHAKGSRRSIPQDLYEIAWRLACDEILQILNSDSTRLIMRGEVSVSHSTA